jgi:hypothetical protein
MRQEEKRKAEVEREKAKEMKVEKDRKKHGMQLFGCA